MFCSQTLSQGSLNGFKLFGKVDIKPMHTPYHIFCPGAPITDVFFLDSIAVLGTLIECQSIVDIAIEVALRQKNYQNLWPKCIGEVASGGEKKTGATLSERETQTISPKNGKTREIVKKVVKYGITLLPFSFSFSIRMISVIILNVIGQ